MTDNILKILNKLKLPTEGTYNNHFYIIFLQDSNEYAKMYTQLSNLAFNTEYPSFVSNTNNSTVKVTNYFEIEEDNITYNIFLCADFEKDQYFIKIGEQ